jgi:hypothetical protein
MSHRATWIGGNARKPCGDRDFVLAVAVDNRVESGPEAVDHS